MKKYWLNNKWVLMMALILGILASFLTTGISLILQEVVDVALTKDTEMFKRLIIFTIIYIAVLCVVNFLSSLTAKYLTERMIKQYRRDVFHGIMSRHPAVYFQQNTADYISALTNDMKLVEDHYIVTLLNTFELVVMFVATFILLVFLSPLVTLILVMTILLMFLVPAVIGKFLEKRQNFVSRQMAQFTEKIKDMFSGYETLRSFNRIENANEQFQNENEKEINMRFRAARLFALNEGISDTLSVLSSITVIFVSAYLVFTDYITMGTLLALVQLSGTFMAPVILMMQNLPKIQSVKAVIERLNIYGSRLKNNRSSQEIPTFKQKVELQQVSFSYKEGVPVLTDVSLTLEKGKKYRITGESGCGKSTLIKILTGYFEEYSGKILYDGQELRTLNTEKIVEIVSVIHQNIFLFNSSIRDNILLGEHFSDEELKEAVEKSGVSLFLEEKENNLDTEVGENGFLLSGGQRQRIALARAFIRHAPIVILDEGTSALDRYTAYEIERCLLQDGDITLITITHNPDPKLMSYYDSTYHMKNGRLYNCGGFHYTD